MVDGASPLHVGDVVTTEAKITSVINTDAGKAVKVIDNIIHQGEPGIEVTSSFLHRGRFTDYEDTLEIVQEPDYVVECPTDASTDVPLSKEWFESNPPTAGTSLIFRLKSEVTFKSKVSYHSITVSGDVYVRDKIKRLVKVGYVDFEQEDCHGNPVVAYVQRHGTAEGTVTSPTTDNLWLTPQQPPSLLHSPTSPTQTSPGTSTHSRQPLLLQLRLFARDHHPRYVDQRSKPEIPGIYCHKGSTRTSQVVSLSFSPFV